MADSIAGMKQKFDEVLHYFEEVTRLKTKQRCLENKNKELQLSQLRICSYIN